MTSARASLRGGVAATTNCAICGPARPEEGVPRVPGEPRPRRAVLVPGYSSLATSASADRKIDFRLSKTLKRRCRMERRKAADFPPEVLRLLDSYIHGASSRREFLDSAAKYAVGGFT